MATSTQVDAILKDDYKDDWTTLNNKVWLLAQLENKKDTVEGRKARHMVHYGRSGGVGARREGVALPTADRQRSVQIQIPVRWQTARIQVTYQLMKMADSNPGAFVDALEFEMEGIKADAMRDVNRQAWGTSNGVIAQCGTTTTSATIQLATTTTTTQMRQLYEGRYVDIGTVASPQTIASARQITSFSVSAKTITVSGATVSTTGSHYVFNYNSGGASDNTGNQDDGQSELTGLQTIVDDSATLHTLSTSTYPTWKAQVSSNSGTNRPLSETTLDLMILNNTVEAGTTINALASNVGVFVAGKSILSAYNRTVDTVEFNGGFKGIKWSTPGVSGIDGKDIGWYADHDCPNNMLFGINFDALVTHQASEGWEWIDADGAILSRVADQAAFEATLITSMEVGCVRRNAHFVIKDLTEAS